MTLDNVSLQTKETPVVGIILAAGQGKRMLSDLPKVMHTIMDKPMLQWAMESMLSAGVTDLNVVVSPSQTIVHECLARLARDPKWQVKQWLQANAQGTAHAVISALPCFQESKGIVIVGFGDTPSVTGKTLKSLLTKHIEDKNAVTILTFRANDPTGYGRIICDSNNKFVAIREQKDCVNDEHLIDRCNSGFLCFDAELGARMLPQIQNTNASQEYYLTDLPNLVSAAGLPVGIFTGTDEHEFAGVNSPQQLSNIAARMKMRESI